MSLCVLMRLLESAPRLGIFLFTMGRLARSYDPLVAYIPDNSRVFAELDFLTIRAARRGATVKGIDVNPGLHSNRYIKLVSQSTLILR